MATKIKSAHIESFERTEGEKPCHVCKDMSHPWFTNAVEKSKGSITYKKIEVDSPEGRAHPEYNDVQTLPHTKVCTTSAKGKQSCRTVKGWNVNEFKDLESLFQ